MGALTDGMLKALVKTGGPLSGKSDGGGLTFTLSKAGTATWVVRYRIRGRQREVTLGNYPDMSLAEARRQAALIRVKVDQGVDPADEKRRAAQTARKTVRQIADDYLVRAGRQLASSSVKEVQRYLGKDLLPRLGSLTAEEVGPRDIVQTIETIAERSDAVARRSFEILSVLFGHALARHDVASNPCAGLRLTSILGPKPPRRQRLKLSLEELRALMAGAVQLGAVNALCVRILLATCVRKGELIRARRELVDLANRTWFVPDEHSKNGKGILIPLAEPVAAWFRTLMELAGPSEWVLPAQKRNQRQAGHHMHRSTINAAIKRLEAQVRRFTPHDLRSTARSHLAALGVDVIVAERCLNHSLGGLVAVYDQHDYLEERRRALELWARLLVDLDSGGRPQNVVPLRQAA